MVDYDLSTIAGFEAHQRVMREQQPRDLRIDARSEADRIWEGVRRACEEKFGRAPSLSPLDQYGEAAIFLSQAEEAESAYLALAHSPMAAPVAIEEAKQTFHTSLLRWVNNVTKHWPPRKVYEAQQRRLKETW